MHSASDSLDYLSRIRTGVIKQDMNKWTELCEKLSRREIQDAERKKAVDRVESRKRIALEVTTAEENIMKKNLASYERLAARLATEKDKKTAVVLKYVLMNVARKCRTSMDIIAWHANRVKRMK